MGRNKKRVKWFPTKPFRWGPNRFFKGLFLLLDWSLPKALSISIGIWGGWHSTSFGVGAQSPRAWRGSSWASQCSWSGGHSRAFPPLHADHLLFCKPLNMDIQQVSVDIDWHFIYISLGFLTKLLLIVRLGTGEQAQWKSTSHVSVKTSFLILSTQMANWESRTLSLPLRRQRQVDLRAPWPSSLTGRIGDLQVHRENLYQNK